MRRGTIVAGLTAGVLGVGGASASAAPLPITLDFTSGSVKVGSVGSATPTGASQLVGTIESDTLVATFPASGVTFAKATVGTIAVTPKATGTITGRPNATTGSIDLSGPISYTLQDGSAAACTIAPTAPITLAGSAIGFADGSFGVSGSGSNASLALSSTACAPYLASAGLLTSTALQYAGKLTIPGFIPTPTITVVTPPVATTPTTPTTPAPVTPAAPKPGKLAVTVSKPRTVKRGSSTVTKVVVRNTGAGTARSVTVKLAASGKGVTPRATTKTYATIGAGKTRTFSVRLRTTKKAAKSSSVKATATGASGLTASKSTTLRLR